MLKKLLICLLLMWVSLFVFAKKTDYYFRHLNTENGLSQNTVLSILQDKTGFMWFGTKDGLNRYDGNSIKVFKRDDNNPYSIGNNTVWSLLEVADGKIWAGTEQGIYTYDPICEKFESFDIKTASGETFPGWIMDMKADLSGNIWIASGNLFCYSPKTNTLKKYTQIYHHTGNNASLLSQVWSINIDNDNQIWLSMLHGGLQRFDPVKEEFVCYAKDATGKDLTSCLISQTMNYNNNHLLIGLINEDMRIMDKTTGEIIPYRLDSSAGESLFVRNMYSFSDKNIWVGTESGLFIHNPQTKETTHLSHNSNDKYTLSDNAVYSMYEDREGGIWVGTYFGGVNYFPRLYTYFEKYYPVANQNSIMGERVSGICEDPEGNIWIGTEDAGLNKLNVKTSHFEYFKPGQYANSLNYHNVHDIICDGDNLWIGTFSRGINVYNLKNKKWKYYQKSNDRGALNNDDVFALYRDSKGQIWVGTSSGAFSFDRETETFIPLTQVKQSFISDIIEDRHGRIWFSTYGGGAYCYNPRTKECTHYDYDQSDPYSICYMKIGSMFIDKKERLWFASESRGICCFDEESGRFIRYGVDQGLNNDVIHKILEDDYSNLWLSSNRGLIRFNPETNKVRVFTQNNGLPANQFNYKSGYKNGSGRMYFGTVNGLITFQPEEFTSNEIIPPVVITAFNLLNNDTTLREKLHHSSSIKLKHHQSSFSIDFSALSYVAPEMNEYAYKMEGLEDHWNFLPSAQRITYSNLPPGKYVFRVKASNNDGLWNEEGDFLAIIILPPFWQTTWAYLVYTFLLLLSGFLIFRYYKNKIVTDNRRKQILFEKEKEKEIYDSKIEFFINVTHEVRTPLTLIKGPLEYILNTNVEKEELDSNLKIMEKNTDRLLSLINQLLDFRKTESKGFSLTFTRTNISELLEETYSRFVPMARQKKLAFSIERIEDPVWADVDKESLIKIISNMFTNAIKYAQTQIVVQLIDHADYFILQVNSDGERIPHELKEKIFEPFFQIGDEKAVKSGSGIGLALVRSLVELHNGHVYLDTAQKDLNSFVISLPKNQKNVIHMDDGKLSLLMDEAGYPEGDIEERKNVYTVLVVEDDEELLQFIEKRLERQYFILKARNGVEAMHILEKELISLVISDIMMPQMDGLELCARIKEDQEYSHIPIILLTAKTNIQSKIAGLESGADAYIEKPFSLEYLQVQITNLLDNRKKIKDAFAHSPLVHTGSIALNKADEQFLNKATEIIYKNISNPDFNVDQFAEALCMSRSSLLRKIKGVSEFTPNDFIKLVRLKRAAEILQEGEYKVNEVCFLVGFSSTSYFSKAFQKQFGMLPKDFKP